MPETLEELDYTVPGPIPARPIVMSGNLTIWPGEVNGKSIAMLGNTGSGKSTSCRRFLEQMMEANVPFSVADIEDEYYGLKELGDVILAGPISHGDAEIDIQLTTEKQCYALATRAYLEKRNVVLMLGDLDDNVRKNFLSAYAMGLFAAGKDVQTRTPHLFVIEEAHEYVPQVGVSRTDACFVALTRCIRRGRKRGIAVMLVSQRPANIAKDLLTQCQIFFCHQVLYPTDKTTYATILDVENLDRRLDDFVPGEVFYFHGKELVQTIISLPKTKSPSITPGRYELPDPECFRPVAEREEIQAEVNNTPTENTDLRVLTVQDHETLLAERASLITQVEQLHRALALSLESDDALEVLERSLAKTYAPGTRTALQMAISALRAAS